MKINHIGALFLSFSLVLSAGCGRGGTGTDGIDGTGFAELSGTAAIGNPIANASVVVRAGDGTKVSGKTDASGKFRIKASKSGYPYLLQVTLPNAKTLYSVAPAAGTVNIHPFTDLIVRNWYKSQGMDIELEFGKAQSIAWPTTEQIHTIRTVVTKILALTLTSFGLPSDLDFLTTIFDANGTGFDRLLDASRVLIINNQVTINVTDPVSGYGGAVAAGVALNSDLTETDKTRPATPNGLRIIPASSTEMIVLWSPSTDNVAVAGYRVYRGATNPHATTPYPVLSDTALAAGTQYCYRVEAIDVSGNVSAPTADVCASTLPATQVDNISPAAPALLTATATGSDMIALSWAASTSADVVGYEIRRGNEGATGTRIATVTMTDFNDSQLPADTRYCYTVTAVDAANNKSAASSQVCAKTHPPLLVKPSSGSGSIAFSATNYRVTEAQTTALITVQRTGDLSEATSVGYQITNGTAASPADFAAANGTLIWAANDASPKFFNVQIKGDDIAEAEETINLTLVQPSGNAALSSSTAVLTVADAACAGVLNHDINAPTTISDSCTLVSRFVYVYADLTLQPGVTLLFADGAGLSVQSNGSLNAVGTPDKPILLTGQQKTPGSWQGLDFSSSNNAKNVLDHVTVEFGGTSATDAAAIKLTGSTSQPQRLSLKHSVLSDSLGFGLILNEGSIVDAFTDNRLTRNAQGPVQAPVNKLGVLDDASDYTGNAKDKIDVTSLYVTDDQTWRALNVPYMLRNHYIDANLTIAPGTMLRFQAAGGLNIQQNGSLYASGQPGNRIAFIGDDVNQGYWSGISFSSSNHSRNVLNHVLVDGGGTGSGSDNAAVQTLGSSSSPSAVTISNTILRNSGGYGFSFAEGTALTFSNVTSTANKQGAGLLPPDLVYALNGGGDFAGNDLGSDKIFVKGMFVNVSQTWPAVNVPYSVGGIYVAANTTLTIAAGAKVQFRSNGFLVVQQGGTLTAMGTPNSPILFTAENPATGWDGIQFSSSTSDANILDYVIVEYGGATPSSGNITLTGSSVMKTKLRLTNSTVRASKGYGLWLFKDAQVNAVQDPSQGNVFSENTNGDVYRVP